MSEVVMTASFEDKFDPKLILLAATDKENQILDFVAQLSECSEVDARWVCIAKTDIEKGFMALKRAIFSGKRVTDQIEKEPEA